ncbi:hypothetical protein IF1G_07496 [Cordyceps javanica]|uniref:Uncharacterized protein n=1 Tax=Cordyceps javanica TaxID=43265 RepID=A0A545UWC8_9HYPO|nr:hypothetical protein IF1G_07496 [Cordyceps javanica]
MSLGVRLGGARLMAGPPISKSTVAVRRHSNLYGYCPCTQTREAIHCLGGLLRGQLRTDDWLLALGTIDCDYLRTLTSGPLATVSQSSCPVIDHKQLPIAVVPRFIMGTCTGALSYCSRRPVRASGEVLGSTEYGY